LRRAEIAKWHDLLITSSKGFSVVAVRRLIDDLCGRRGLPLYILHDFDISGFSGATQK
jgi:DNA topoisomerase VI subunit A